jgi:hypothetical protein
MSVPGFPTKFRMLQRALAERGIKLRDQAFWTGLFPKTVKKESAQSMWSSYKNGSRDFPESKLDALLRVIDSAVPGILAGTDSDIFHLPAASLQAKLVKRGVLHSVIPDTRPLSETLVRLSNTEGTFQLLNQFDRTRHCVDQFEFAFRRLLLEDKGREIAELFYDAVLKWWGSHQYGHASKMSAAVLCRIWPLLTGSPTIRRVSSRVEKLIDGEKAELVLLAEPLSYIGAFLGRHGPFKKNIERMIVDPRWRSLDHRARLRYWGGHRNTGDSANLERYSGEGRIIAAHLAQRREYPQILCHDVGRVISIYRHLIDYNEYADLATYIKEETLKALANADITRRLRDQAEDRIEGR